ncbi:MULTISPECIES: DUF2756 family protein [Enterobacteriaceae]|uniref:DUF2756 family protein n=1 Tax=Enterobacteriaceae TaxID=543 RepID=UPI000497B3FF|nr:MULTISPECIES: DUF2756 family protein [Enterobacteriaceae]MCZ6412839.1 DUF2756 family protein [Cronobacter sakazakii]HBI09316.1 DUF2756 domain-containing protein [Franconibacter pulveris]
MKRTWLLAALLPCCALAQPLNVTNNPNLPGYQIPAQQRLQTQMQIEQNQRQTMLNQQVQSQTRLQQQHLESQINNNTQRMRQSQPGELNPQTQQVLPNTSGSMLSSGGEQRMLNSSVNQSGMTSGGGQDRMLNNSASMTQESHMLPQRSNGDMLQQNNGTLNNNSTGTMPQPNVPLKTIGP